MSDLTQLQKYYLQQMGIVCWQEKQEEATAQPISKPDWTVFTESLRHCDVCHLFDKYNETLGSGNLAANLVIVGLNRQTIDEKTKKLLENILDVIGLSASDIFMSDLFSAQPAMTTQEAVHYLSHFQMQLNLIKPKVLLSFDQAVTIVLKDLILPIVEICSLEQMLKSPSKKREAYKQLVALNKVLITDSGWE